jgi:uncharacterized repeat protein (TIGR01451 family)
MARAMLELCLKSKAHGVESKVELSWSAIRHRASRALLAATIPDIVMRIIAILRKMPASANDSCVRLLTTIAAMLLSMPPAALAQRQWLHGHVPAAAARSRPVGDLDGTKSLEVLIGLPLRNREALTNLLNDLYDPASASFHQYLTPGQFMQEFGPTTTDYESVISFAKSNGLTVLQTHANRTILDVSGSVAEIEKAFHVHLRLYQHPTEPRKFYAPDGEPSVDLATPVLGITGLDNFVVPHPQSLRAAKRKAARPMYGSAPDGNYWGNDFRAAYVPGTSLTGAGQKVGLFELDDFYSADISTYESNASLASVPLSRLFVDGATAGPGANNAEVALDIEMAVSMAPGLSEVIVYEGPNGNNVAQPNAILNCMATNDAAEQLSCSWGFGINSTTEQIFQQFASQGQSFFLASGDSGAFLGPAAPPGDDPYITVVGGTTLTTSGGGGSWVSETVWNWFSSDSGTNASTGGISTTYAIPSWQAPVSMASNQGSSTMRNVPDVALTADNVWVVYNDGQSGEFGGTSCAAPLWAAFTALVNEQGALNQRGGIGFLNPALYALGLGSNYATTFHDITTGNNTNLISPSKFYAATGYDLCTGWGTPNGTGMINALAPPATSPVLTGTATLAFESCLPTNGVIDPGETVTINLTLTNVSHIGTTNLVATLQAGSDVLVPTRPQTYGALTGGGAAVTQPFTFTAGGVCGQTISVVWQLQDGAANLGSVSFNFALGVLVSATTLAQNFDGVTAPALPAGWTTSATGSQVDWATTTAASDTLPNSAFATDAANTGVAYLYSPIIPIISSNAQLTFRQNYNLEASTHRHTTYYDGGVLDIAIGAGSFNDIITSGGSFVTGGYNGSLYTGSGNPLAGREAWSGDSGGWITTTINLPASAAGQNIQLCWECGTDDGNSTPVVGWYVDTISLRDAYSSCCGDSADVSVVQTATPQQFVVGENGTFTITVTNAGPDLAADVVVTDTLPESVTFVSASAGSVYSNGMIVFPIGAISSGASSTVTLTVLADQTGVITNSAITASVTPGTDVGNIAVVNVTEAGTSPGISAQPSNVVAVAGRNASFQVAATGSAPLSYHWFFDATNLIAGASSEQLTLTNVQPNQAGNYTVVVTNSAGSITSAPAILRVLAPPAIVAGSVGVTAGNGLSVSVNSVVGLNYTLGYKNSLTDPAWTVLPASAVSGTGGVIILHDTSAPQSQRFYLVIAN